MVIYVFHRKPKLLDIPEGKIICIVPAYNETPGSLYNCIESLRRQTVSIDKIFVIDDGSRAPAALSKEHESCDNIVLIRLDKNCGKRGAQALVLRHINSKDYPFLLTVDSDSYLTPGALESMIRHMSNKRIKACTGTVLASNYSNNIITKVQDFSYGMALSITRSATRAFKLLDTTSGACSLYRTEIIYHYLNDYLEHGKSYPYGDDRRFALYSLMEGGAIYVPEAIVYTDTPDNMKSLWRQRVRWSQGGWSGIPYMITNIGVGKSIFQIQSGFFSFLLPVMLAMMIYQAIVNNSPWIFYYLTFILITTYTSLLFYICSQYEIPTVESEIYDIKHTSVFSPSHKYKPSYLHRMSGSKRLVDWVIITPFLIVFTQIYCVATKTVGLFKVIRGRREWGTR